MVNGTTKFIHQRNETGHLLFSNALDRIAQLRLLGYEIELSGLCSRMRLVSEPDVELPLLERLGNVFLSDDRAIGNCEHCGKKYSFNPKIPKLTCKKNCQEKLRRLPK